jgi:hypothetical protein
MSNQLKRAAKAAARDRYRRSTDSESDDSAELDRQLKREKTTQIYGADLNRNRQMERHLNVELLSKRKRINWQFKNLPIHGTLIRYFLLFHSVFLI